MSIKNIFFDFDGVIADSVNVKTEAFRKMYLPYGEDIANKVTVHHTNNGGMSRFEKFKLYHKEYLGVDIDSDLLKQLAEQFSQIVIQDVIDSEEIKGIQEFLDSNYKRYKFFVITGTPTSEAKIIVNKRNLEKYFIEVLGSPKKKEYWSDYLLKKYNLNSEETIFIGDALADYNAAKEYKLKFVLRQCEDNIDLFKNKLVDLRINDFIDFNLALKKI